MASASLARISAAGSVQVCSISAYFGPSVLVGNVAVLDDQGHHALGRPNGQARADGRSEVVEVEDEALDAQRPHEAIEETGIAVEAVVEIGGRRAVPGARVVRRQQPPAVGQRRQQVSELIRRARIAVREQNHRRAGGPGLAVERLDAVDRAAPMPDACVHRHAPPRSPSAEAYPACPRT
jgi:hypothetical protein